MLQVAAVGLPGRNGATAALSALLPAAWRLDTASGDLLPAGHASGLPLSRSRANAHHLGGRVARSRQSKTSPRLILFDSQKRCLVRSRQSKTASRLIAKEAGPKKKEGRWEAVEGGGGGVVFMSVF